MLTDTVHKRPAMSFFTLVLFLLSFSSSRGLQNQVLPNSEFDQEVSFEDPRPQKTVIQGCLSYYQNTCHYCVQPPNPSKSLKREKSNIVYSGCGPISYNQTTKGCLIYGLKSPFGPPNSCIQCQEGFKLVFSKTRSRAPRCLPSSLPHCVNEIQEDDNTPQCYLCSKGYYLVASSFQGLQGSFGCVSQNQVQNPASNCLWGSFSFKTTTLCARCTASLTLGPTSKKCFKSNLDGCWSQTKDDKCKFCDGFNGFSMQPDGSCLNV